MFKSLSIFIKTKILRNSQARWDRQYQVGIWEGLKDELEMDRQQACRSLINQYKPHSSILEVGCGEGIFIKNIIKKDEYSQYLGLDVSEFVIQKTALELSDSKTKFSQEDMDNFRLKERFDVIFFNESLNYAKNIVATLDYCKTYLSKTDAIFIISLHKHKQSPEHWAEVHKCLKTIDSKSVKNERAEWYIEVLK